MNSSGAFVSRERNVMLAPPVPHNRCHHPRRRMIQYAAAVVIQSRRRWDTGSPACAGDDGGESVDAPTSSLRAK